MTLSRAPYLLNDGDKNPVGSSERRPENGPRVLFFSGGSALNGLARTLKHYSHQSIHLVTPFDSGGSSAALRHAFDMPAIGDLRSRLMALADDSRCGHPEIVALFQQRFSTDQSHAELQRQLKELIDGRAATLNGVPEHVTKLICELLASFQLAMPQDFDLRGASIGNLILAGGFLHHQRDLRPVIAQFSEMVYVHGTVLPVVDAPLHLGVRLVDGREIIGQHRITGKEVAPLSVPVEALFLSASRTESLPVIPQIDPEVQALIEDAQLICFPPGSFFSSLLANLLPAGVCRAVAANPACKVYVPNLGCDPEQLGYGVADCIRSLRRMLLRDNPSHAAVLDVLLIDRRHDRYVGLPDAAQLKEWGVQLVEADLVTASSGHYYDNERLTAALLALAQRDYQRGSAPTDD